MLLLWPGHVSDWLSLQECLRQQWDGMREERARELAERKLHGAPAIDEASGDALEPLPEYEPTPDLDGVEVRLRLLSDADRRDIMARLSVAFAATLAAHKASADAVTLRRLDEEASQVQCDMLRAALVGVRGIEDADGPKQIDDVDAALPALRRAGLLAPLFRVCRTYQELPAKKALRFGVPQPSTLGESSTAPDAPRHGARSSDALPTDQQSSSVAPDTNQPDARGAASSTTPTSSQPSPSGAQ